MLFIKIENTSKFYAFLDFGFFFWGGGGGEREVWADCEMLLSTWKPVMLFAL